MVRLAGFVKLLSGNRVAPELLPVPTVTVPAIMPCPLSVPELTCTAPVPVAEPLVLLTTSLPLFTKVPPL